MNIRHLAAILIATIAWGNTAAAQDAPLTAADKRSVVEQLGQTLEANYVFPDKAKTIAATLRRHLDAGDYDTATDRRMLASELTDDLVAASNDLHFSVGVVPHPPRRRCALSRMATR